MEHLLIEHITKDQIDRYYDANSYNISMELGDHVAFLHYYAGISFNTLGKISDLDPSTISSICKKARWGRSYQVHKKTAYKLGTIINNLSDTIRIFEEQREEIKALEKKVQQKEKQRLQMEAKCSKKIEDANKRISQQRDILMDKLTDAIASIPHTI